MTEYYLTDALGSVCQLVDANSAVTLTQSYSPYGAVTQSVGTSQTIRLHRRNARCNGIDLSPGRGTMLRKPGRFLSRDTWGGDYTRPLSLNRWNYVKGNPVDLTDPSGHWSCQDPICLEPARDFDATFNQLLLFSLGELISKICQMTSRLLGINSFLYGPFIWERDCLSPRS